MTTAPAVLAAHLRAMFAGYLRDCRRNGLPVPPELAAMLDALTIRSAQERPNLADDGPDPHAVAVSYSIAAKRLGVSVSTVRRMAADGRLAAVRAGRRVLVPVVALEAYAGKGAA